MGVEWLGEPESFYNLIGGKEEGGREREGEVKGVGKELGREVEREATIM